HMNSRSFIDQRVIVIGLILSVLFGVSRFSSHSAYAAPLSGDDNPFVDKFSADILEKQRTSHDPSELVDVILKLSTRPTAQLAALLNRNQVHVAGYFDSFNTYAVTLPLGVVDELANYPEVEVINLDNQFQVLGHVTITTG